MIEFMFAQLKSTQAIPVLWVDWVPCPQWNCHYLKKSQHVDKCKRRLPIAIKFVTNLN